MKMNKKYILFFIICILGFYFISPSLSFAATNQTFTLSPNSEPYENHYTHYHTYNAYTKQYYSLRSYLEHLEETQGGTLILTKGTYTISNTLYVPSNVTIILNDGVKIIKGNKTGIKTLIPSHSIFQLVRPSRAAKKNVYGKYTGEKNIAFIGKGNATIDMKFKKDGIAIIAGHNENIKINNIHFQNMYSGHFIEMDATNHASITNNVFRNSIASANKNKEAINLDTPDRSTRGWSQQWSTFDKTANRYITIANNTFSNLDRSIGTHKYSGGKFHDHIMIRNNKIDHMRNDAIRVMNWSNATIENNTITNVANRKGIFRAILASGAINPTFQHNVIENVSRPIQFMAWKNSGPGSQYAITYNRLTKNNIKALMTNKTIHTNENFIRINHKYNVFDHPQKIYLKNHMLQAGLHRIMYLFTPGDLF